jgi:hypothetical protein
VIVKHCTVKTMMNMRRISGSMGSVLAVAVGALGCAGSAEGGARDAGGTAGADSAAGGATSSNGGSSTGGADASGGAAAGVAGAIGGGAGAGGGADSSAGGAGSSGGAGAGGATSSGPIAPPVYRVTPAPEWDAVFNSTGHNGDGFQWVPLGIKDRQGLGTPSTSSVILFNDSNYVGHFFNATAGEYTSVTPDTSKISWRYGTNGQKADFRNLWDTTRAESGYGGTVAWNLVNNYGMSGIRGTADTHDTDYRKMWLSERAPSAANGYIVLDSYGARKLGKMYVWNFNDPNNTNKGLKNIRVYTSADGATYTEYTGGGYPFQIPQASGTGPEGYNKIIDLNGTSARYVKIAYNPVSGDGNWGAADTYGLGAVRIYDAAEDKLLLAAKAGSTGTRTVYGGNPWNMAAFSLGNYVYFVLHNAEGCCTPFKSNATQLMRYTVVAGAVDWTTLTAFESLPYMYYPVIPGGFSPHPDDARAGDYYRVVQFENLAFWNDDDGYVYMLGADESNQYGVWNDKSKVVLSRVPSGSFEDFNARQYWNGSAWAKNYEDAKDLVDVHGEAIYPVGNMPGYFKAQGGQLNGKYVFVYMEGVSGSSYFRYADNPWGPWSEKNLLYARRATDSDTVYNTGAVPFISKAGEFYFYEIRNGQGMQFFKYAELTPQTSLSTGFESGDAPAPWSDTVNAVSNVSGYMPGLAPQCAVRNGEQSHGGRSALMYSGSAGGGASANVSYDVFGVLLPISGSMVLDYWIYPQQDNGRYVAVDLHCTDGSTLRESGAVDQNGYGARPSAGHGGNIPLNAWSEVRIDIGTKLAGKTVDKILVGYDRPGSSGQFRGYIDDLAIGH